MHSRLRSEVSIRGTRIVGKLIGKGFAFAPGEDRVDEKYIIEVDMSRMALHELAPYLKHIVVDPSMLK
jgi:hypothetical protein